jgi:hypothetical protein
MKIHLALKVALSGTPRQAIKLEDSMSRENLPSPELLQPALPAARL